MKDIDRISSQRRVMIVKKLAQMECANLSDIEIERCLSGCVASVKLTICAKYLVHEGLITMLDIQSAP